MDEANATADHLAYVNDAGQAIIRVDNTSDFPKIDPKIYNVTRNTVGLYTLVFSRDPPYKSAFRCALRQKNFSISAV